MYVSDASMIVSTSCFDEGHHELNRQAYVLHMYGLGGTSFP